MKTYKLTLIGLFTAILCILGPIAIVLPFSPVPVSLGTLGVLLACLVLSPSDALLCTALYLLIGFVGLPVFTGFSGGVGRLLGPTGGYMIGYLALAFAGSKLAHHLKKHMLLQAMGLFFGMCICYLFGTLWLAFQAQLDFSSALWMGVIPYVPFDVIKIAAAIVFARAIGGRLGAYITLT